MASKPSETASFRAIDFSQLSVRERYKHLVNFLVPRPIALISTVSAAGKINVASFSSINLVASEPPTLVFSVACRRDGHEKDTLRNIRATGEFVANMAHTEMLEVVASCGAELPEDVSEAEVLGLQLIPSLFVRPPRLAISRVQFECTLLSLVPVGATVGTPGTSIMVLGKILGLHLRSELAGCDIPDYRALNPLAKLGGTLYSALGAIDEQSIPHAQGLLSQLPQGHPLRKMP